MKTRQLKHDVLILGEPGVGKRHLASQMGANRGGKREFLVIDGLSASYQDVRLALSRARDGSALCVANIDRLGPHTQAEVVSFLKGGTKDRTSKVIVTATTLEKVEPDLATLLKSFQTIAIAPLRERLEELPDLAKSIVRDLCRTMGRSEINVGEGIIRVLQRGSWPENVRGLYNALAKAVIKSSGDQLELQQDSFNEHQYVGNAIENIHAGRDFVLDDALWMIERHLIERALKTFQYNQSRTAMLFGLSEANFRYRLKKFNLPSIRGVRQ